MDFQKRAKRASANGFLRAKRAFAIKFLKSEQSERLRQDFSERSERSRIDFCERSERTRIDFCEGIGKQLDKIDFENRRWMKSKIHCNKLTNIGEMMLQSIFLK